MAPWWKKHVLAFTKEYQLWNHTHNTGAFDSQILCKKCGCPPSKCPAAIVVDPLVGNPLLSFSRSISTRQCQCHCQCQATNMLSGITAQVHGLTPYKATSNIKKLIIILTHNLQMCVWDEITKQKIFLILFYVLYLFNPPLWKSTIPTSSSNRHFPNRKSDPAPSSIFYRDFYPQSKGSERVRLGSEMEAELFEREKYFRTVLNIWWSPFIQQPRFMSWLLLDSIKI